ncbi:MAG: hypothetical protein H6581_15900 [Bacteroidia bacterium]|nr:hypothetical protein [Bacteroidia bacterium]
MKKSAVLLSLGLFAGMLFLASCGNGKAEAEAKAKALADSLRNDSIMKAEKAAAMEAARLDSLRQDSLEALVSELEKEAGKTKVVYRDNPKTTPKEDPATKVVVKNNDTKANVENVKPVKEVTTTKTNTNTQTGTATTKGNTTPPAGDGTNKTTTKTTKTKTGN